MKSISFSNISKKYGDLTVTSIDSLKIEDGEIVCIVGPSGCGKTTTLRIIAGLIQQDEGDVFFGEEVVNNLLPEHRNAAMVFQNYALFPHMTVFDNVAFGLTVRKKSKQDIAERVRSVLELVQLTEVGERLPDQLSGGQQQRIALARALAIEPDILLFDEPLSNLDAKLREYMRFELRQLLEKLNITTVYVTHDQTEAMVIGNRMIVMNAGKIVQDSTPLEIYHRPANRFVADFIGTASFVDGKVSTQPSGDGLVCLEDEDGLMLWGHPVSVKIGDRVSACVRPETIQIALSNSKDSGARNRLDAEVQNVTDLGEIRELHLKVGRWELRTRVTTTTKLVAGQTIAIDIDPKGCTIVAS